MVSVRFVGQVDAIQYGIEEGPYALGAQRALAIPLPTSDGVRGAMNVYAHDRAAFDEHAALIGELFAAFAVQYPQALAQARRLTA